jgi:hypothetical protein
VDPRPDGRHLIGLRDPLPREAAVARVATACERTGPRARRGAFFISDGSFGRAFQEALSSRHFWRLLRPPLLPAGARPDDAADDERREDTPEPAPGRDEPLPSAARREPVDWYPWGREALDRARAEAKPIFLSIGYSACHWCHVMERESFENEAIAALLNDSFVSVKVDREERPDLDEIYMKAVQSMTGSGGWPMSVFLTPDLEPFYGGTYFPPRSSHGRPGFAELITALARAWRDDRANVAAHGKKLAERIAAEGRGTRRARSLPTCSIDRSRRSPAPMIRSGEVSGARRSSRTPSTSGSSCATRRERERGRAPRRDHDARPHGGRRDPRPPRRGVSPLQHGREVVDPPLREDALRHGAARAGLPRGPPLDGLAGARARRPRGLRLDPARDGRARRRLREQPGRRQRRRGRTVLRLEPGRSRARARPEARRLGRRVVRRHSGRQFRAREERAVAQRAGRDGRREARRRPGRARHGDGRGSRAALESARRARPPGNRRQGPRLVERLAISALAQAYQVLGDARWLEAAMRAARFVLEKMRGRTDGSSRLHARCRARHKRT